MVSTASQASERFQNVLDEGRILILGAQILLGLLYRSVFEPGYDRLPQLSQYLMISALLLIVLAFILLTWPITYHRILRPRRWRLQKFVERIMLPALPLFALSTGLTLYIATEKLAGPALGLVAGGASTALALFLWHGIRDRGPERKHQFMDQNEAEEALDQKIRHVLTEARMVLPGAQALLGFQFITMVLDGFDRLPPAAKQVHLISLLATALSTIFLMTPAAHHRIVEHGEISEHFYRFAAMFVVLAMIPLAFGIAGAFFVVVQKVTGSTAFAAISAAVLLSVAYGLWFGFTLYQRVGKSD